MWRAGWAAEATGGAVVPPTSFLAATVPVQTGAPAAEDVDEAAPPLAEIAEVVVRPAACKRPRTEAEDEGAAAVTG